MWSFHYKITEDPKPFLCCSDIKVNDKVKGTWAACLHLWEGGRHSSTGCKPHLDLWKPAFHESKSKIGQFHTLLLKPLNCGLEQKYFQNLFSICRYKKVWFPHFFFPATKWQQTRSSSDLSKFFRMFSVGLSRYNGTCDEDRN